MTNKPRADIAQRDGQVLDVLRKTGPMNRGMLEEALDVDWDIYRSLYRLRADGYITSSGGRKNCIWTVVDGNE